MKKLLSAMSLIFGLGLATAQQTATATNNVPVQRPVKATDAAQSKVDAKVAKPEQPTAKIKVNKLERHAVKLKKDGTPDRRYRQNKHLKKDGTPDRRYKENKKV